jgi:hypothetical protein
MTTAKFLGDREVMPGLTRKDGGRMKRKDLSRIMSSLIADAQAISIDELQAARQKATQYYNGDPFGTEEEGRSQVVVTEVRDQVLGVKPSLMRLFLGPQSAVEFVPRTEEGAAGSRQATDYANYVFRDENSGFRIVNDLLDDGLIRRLAIVKWSWTEGEVISDVAEDLTTDELFELAAKDDVTLTSVVDNKKDGEEYRATVEYQVKQEGCVKLETLPPEEFMFDSEATGIENATLIGHGRNLTAGDLIALGVKEQDIDDHGGLLNTLDQSADAIKRNERTTSNKGTQLDAGEENELHFYAECYVRIDVDGDGKRELRRVRVLGPGFYIIDDKPAPEVPFAIFTPIPEPHALVGLGLADLVMDLQYIKSHLTRGMLDSFALSVFPRMSFVEGQVSLEDVLNTEIGAPIRTKRPGVVESFTHPFTGQAAMPLLEYFDQMGENRTGRNRGAMSLDADALQSSTKGAVQAALTAAQERTEFLGRQFAEQTAKPMFKGIYRLLLKYKPKNTLIKLRGEFVPIDVSSWDADYTCVVNVALGLSLPEQRKETLIATAAAQKEALQLGGMGPENPLTSLSQYRNTLSDILALDGFMDTTRYWKPVAPDYAPPPPPEQKTPEQTIAEANIQIEKTKSIRDIAIKQAELELKQRQQEWKEKFDLLKLSEEVTLRRYQIDSQFHTEHTRMMEELDAAADESAMRLILDGRRQAHAERVQDDTNTNARNNIAHEAVQAHLDRTHAADLQGDSMQHEKELAAMSTDDTGEE